MKTKLFLLGLLVSTMTMVGQTTSTTDSKPETWYFKLGGSYFMQTAATEFPTVSGALPNTMCMLQMELLWFLEKQITGSFGEGFRTGLNARISFFNTFGC